MTDRELLKEARDLIVMCSLLDKSGQCEAMADKIDKQLSIANVSESFSKDDLLDLGGWFDGSPEFVEEVVSDWLNAR